MKEVGDTAASAQLTERANYWHSVRQMLETLRMTHEPVRPTIERLT